MLPQANHHFKFDTQEGHATEIQKQVTEHAYTGSNFAALGVPMDTPSLRRSRQAIG